MAEQKRSRRTRFATLGLGATALAGVILGMGGATAGATYAACSGSQIFDIPGMQGVELYEVSGYDVATYDLGFSLEAGTYDISASSFDGYIGRSEVPVEKQEKSERWWAEFLDADGNVVGVFPGPTTDLPDDTDVAEVVDLFQDVELDATATQVRFVLIKDGLSLNLVHVGCVGFERQQATTTTAPVDEETTTTVTPQPTTTTAAPVSTTAAPASTTSSIPVTVLASTLPFTGDHTGLIAAAGGATVAAGLALVLRSRRLSA